MDKSSQINSPFYTAYMQQKNIIDSAIDAAVTESASKMTAKQLSKLFAIDSFPVMENKAA